MLKSQPLAEREELLAALMHFMEYQNSYFGIERGRILFSEMKILDSDDTDFEI